MEFAQTKTFLGSFNYACSSSWKSSKLIRKVNYFDSSLLQMRIIISLIILWWTF